MSEDPTVAVCTLRREVAELKQELAMHDSFAGGGGAAGGARKYDAYSDSQKAELRPMVLRFLAGDGGGAIHSSTFRLNISAFCGTGAHLGVVQGVIMGCQGILRGG